MYKNNALGGYFAVYVANLIIIIPLEKTILKHGTAY